jgi:hypothetical protein
LDQQRRYQIQDVEQIHQVIENRAVVRPEGTREKDGNAKDSGEQQQEKKHVDATAEYEA